ncbi:MAG: LacI family DNA-binding transcriptional regulator [Enterocloster sp.]
MKQITIKDIAREAGVSVASVSRALNGMGGISEANRSRILEVCRQRSYTPNGLARGLVKQKTQTIGIIMPDIQSPFYSELMVLASDAAHKRNYQVLLCNSFRDLREEDRYLKLLVENQVEGILIFPIGSHSADSLSRYEEKVPIVSLNEMPSGCRIPYVCADERLAGKIAAEYLISRGCKNLLFVGFKPERLAHRCRAASFLEAAKSRRIPAQVYECSMDYRSSFERGYGHFKHFLLQGTPMPDGIVAASDATANGIVKACKENGIRVPEDFSLIGFDNISTELPYIELTTVAVSHEEQVTTAINLLLDMIDGKQLSRAEVAVKLEPRLVERRSCKG